MRVGTYLNMKRPSYHFELLCITYTLYTYSHIISIASTIKKIDLKFLINNCSVSDVI